LEILLGLSTPAAYNKQRMNYQIGRMSESMLSRKEQRQVEPQAFKLFKQWYRLPLSQAAFEQQQPRIQAAIDSLQTQQGLSKPAPKMEAIATESSPTEVSEVNAVEEVSTLVATELSTLANEAVETSQIITQELSTSEAVNTPDKTA
jgi:hypothetical protein